MDTLITNVTAVTMAPGTEVLFGVNIAVTDGKIEFISKKVPQELPQTIIDGTGMVAMPGLINCHTHLATSVLRCYTDDLSNRQALEELLKCFSVSVTGPRPVAEAIVTSGGVQVSQVQPSTMESKLAPGLYFAGEILDVDAYTGGFNLQIAWSTGHLAGTSAAGAEGE